MSRPGDEPGDGAGHADAGGRARRAPAGPQTAEPVIRRDGTAARDAIAADPAPRGEGATEGAPEPQGAARPDTAETARARAATAAGRMPGTTHDPNSVTTMTEAEPDGDVYPPPGTSEDR